MAIIYWEGSQKLWSFGSLSKHCQSSHFSPICTTFVQSQSHGGKLATFQYNCLLFRFYLKICQSFLWVYHRSLGRLEIALHETTCILFVLQEIVLSCSRPFRSALQYEYRYASSTQETPSYQCEIPVSDSGHPEKPVPWLLIYSAYKFGITAVLVFNNAKIISELVQQKHLYMHVCFCILLAGFYFPGWLHCCAPLCFCVCACACPLLLLLLLPCWQSPMAVVSQIAEESLAKAWPCHSYSLPWRESRAPQIWAQVLTLTDTVNTDLGGIRGEIFCSWLDAGK